MNTCYGERAGLQQRCTAPAQLHCTSTARTEDREAPRYRYERRCDSIAATLKQANTAAVPRNAVSSSPGLTASTADTSGPSVAPWLNAAPASSRYLVARLY